MKIRNTLGGIGNPILIMEKNPTPVQKIGQVFEPVNRRTFLFKF